MLRDVPLEILPPEDASGVPEQVRRGTCVCVVGLEYSWRGSSPLGSVGLMMASEEAETCCFINTAATPSY